MGFSATSKVKHSAVGILARRDHSEFELRQKLTQREYSPEEINQAVAYCYEYDWLDDQRVAESLLRYGVSKGYGWQRICLDATRKGLARTLLETAQQTQQHDWYQLAKKLALRRFADHDDRLPQADFKLKSKWYRYLQNRGFSHDEIQYALSNE